MLFANHCKIEVRFICDTHKQPDCFYFSKDNNIPTVTCKYGLPDRKCSNDNAIEQTVKHYFLNRIYKDADKT